MNTTGITSILSYPDRGEGGSSRYRGNCSPKLVEEILGFYRPSFVCDYMCGSGTTKAVADGLGMENRIYDLHSGFDMLNCEIRERPDMIFWHPPYWDAVVYSDNMYSAQHVMRSHGYDPRRSDLSRIRKWDDFVEVLNYAALKQFTALEKGGRMAVLMGDIRKRGRLYSMISEIVKPGTLENILIKVQHNCLSYGRQYSGRFIPIVHEYLLIVRKDDPLAIPVLRSEKGVRDIRDMAGASWKDVIASVLDACGPLPLSGIYEKISLHEKAKKTNHPKEKVRQTLGLYPQLFRKDGRGYWDTVKA